LEGGSLKGHAAMMLAVFFWGTSFISIKVVLVEVPPVTMALLRFVLATALLFVLLHKMEPSARLKRQDIHRLVLAGFLGVCLYFYLENNGMRLTTASNAALITAVIPLLATLLDVIVYKSRLTLMQSAGMLLALGGTYMAITANRQISLASGNLKGNILIVCAALSWTVFTLYTKSLQRSYSGLFLTAWQNLSGTLLLFPLALAEHGDWQMISLRTGLHLLYLAVCCSAGCYLLYNYALQKLDVAATTVYLNLVPVIGVAGGFLFLKETVLPVQLAGGCVIMAGVIVVQYRPRGFRKGQYVESQPGTGENTTAT
jgi:drug/metabolite transporter (DMT)-like permease